MGGKNLDKLGVYKARFVRTTTNRHMRKRIGKNLRQRGKTRQESGNKKHVQLILPSWRAVHRHPGRKRSPESLASGVYLGSVPKKNEKVHTGWETARHDKNCLAEGPEKKDYRFGSGWSSKTRQQGPNARATDGGGGERKVCNKDNWNKGKNLKQNKKKVKMGRGGGGAIWLLTHPPVVSAIKTGGVCVEEKKMEKGYFLQGGKKRNGTGPCLSRLSPDQKFCKRPKLDRCGCCGWKIFLH